MENLYLFEEKKRKDLIFFNYLFGERIGRFRKINRAKTVLTKLIRTWLSLFLLCSLVSLFNTHASAQSCANYTVSRSTGITYSSISTLSPSNFTWRNTTSNQNDDNRSFQAPIGFDFWYLGVRYTQFSGDLNGFIDFSSSTSDGNSALMSSPYAYAGNYMNVFSTANASMLSVAPMYDDLWTAGSGTTPIANSIVYQTSGSAPNRVLTVEWINFDKFGSSSGSINFQLKLYESTGVIEFIYGTMTAGSASLVYCCGINGNWTSGSPTAAKLLTQQTANTTTFSNTAKNNLSVMPASNSKLTFTPPSPTSAPTSLSFSSVAKTTTALNWTDNATNEIGYVIYNSTDNINFDFVSQTAANATSTTVSGLYSGTTYYWQVYAVTEGKLSSALSGTQSTLAPGNITSNTSGLWSVGSTWAGGVAPTLGDNVTIANGHTVTLDANVTCDNLTVGQGTSGQLTIGNNSTSRSLAVISNVTINSGATLTIGTTSATHTMNINGDITNNGIINLKPTSTRICNVTFNNDGNQSLSGTGTTNTFNNIVVNMGSSNSNELTVSVSNFSVPSNFLTLTNGTFKLSAAATITPFTSSTTISSTCGLWVNNGSATINTTGGTITLFGYIHSSLGTINIGNSSNNNLTSYGGTVTIDGGNINIAGRLDKHGPTVLTNFTISSGIFKVATVGSTTASLAPFNMDEVGSTFNMSGGTIIIERSGAGNLGFVNTGGTIGSVSGGTLQIGDASTPSSQTIQINSSVSIPNLVISNGVAVTAQLVTNSLTVLSNITINSGTLNSNSLNITLGGNWVNGGTFTASSGTVNFNGTTQTLSGSATTFKNLIFSNSGLKTLTTANCSINGTLSMEGTATVSATPTYGASATLQYNTSTSRTAGVEWKSTFNSSGGIIITNTGTISLNSSKTVNSPASLTVSSGASFNLGSYVLSGSASYTLNATGEVQTGNASGITSSGASGAVQVSGIRTFSNTANYTYNGSSTQVFGNGLPSTVNNLTINNGNTAMALNGSQTINGTLTLTSGKLSIGANTLTLNGDFTGSATNSLQGNGSTSNLTIGGSGTIGTLYFDQTTSGTTNRLQNLTINRSTQTVTIGDTLQIIGTVTPTAGTLASAGYLTIISNASGTARIAAIAGGADVTGNVTVQRYFPAVTRRFRMVSSPDQNFTWSQIKNNMFVSGSGGTANGFDSTSTNPSTCYTYQESTSGGRGWKAATNITNSVSSAIGTIVYVRGDRTIPSPDWYTGPTYTAQNAVTVDFANQPINKGTYSPTITYTNTGVAGNDGWNLVGNPYPSQIDWSLISKTNLSSFFYIYNPTTGSYVSANSGIIASGQAFFVQATAASPSITFSESSKTSSTAAYYFKTAPSRIQIDMVKDSLNSDVAWLDFNSNSSKGYNSNEDALKYSNSAVNVGFYLDSVTSTQFNSVPMTASTDTFTLSANATAGTYSLKFTDIASLPTSKNIYLYDLYNSNLIDLKTTSGYSFTITSASASHGNRFLIIVIDPSSLPVSWLSFTGVKQNNSDVLLNWKTANEKNNNHFVVERSLDNNAFEEINLVNAIGNSVSTSSYNYIDKNIFTSDLKLVYYRIKQIDVDGKFDYSQTISVNNNLKTVQTNVSVSPNPANDFINLTLSNKTLGNVTIEILDITGKVIISTVSSNTKDAININTQNLQSGIYFIRILSQQNISSITKFIKN